MPCNRRPDLMLVIINYCYYNYKKDPPEDGKIIPFTQEKAGTRNEQTKVYVAKNSVK